VSEKYPRSKKFLRITLSLVILQRGSEDFLTKTLTRKKGGSK